MDTACGRQAKIISIERDPDMKWRLQVSDLHLKYENYRHITEETCLEEFHRQQCDRVKIMLLERLGELLGSCTHCTTSMDRQLITRLKYIVYIGEKNIDEMSNSSLCNYLKIVNNNKNGIPYAQFPSTHLNSEQLIPIQYMNLLLPVRTEQSITTCLDSWGHYYEVIARLKKSITNKNIGHSRYSYLSTVKNIVRNCSAMNENIDIFDNANSEDTYLDVLNQFSNSCDKFGVNIRNLGIFNSVRLKNNIHWATIEEIAYYNFITEKSDLQKAEMRPFHIDLVEKKISCYVNLGNFDAAQIVLGGLVNRYFPEDEIGPYSIQLADLTERISTEKYGDQLKQEAHTKLQEGDLEDALWLQRQRKYQTTSAFVLVDSCYDTAVILKTMGETDRASKLLLFTIEEQLVVYFLDNKQLFRKFRKLFSSFQLSAAVSLNVAAHSGDYITDRSRPSCQKRIYNQYEGVLHDQFENYSLRINMGDIGYLACSDTDSNFVFTSYVYPGSACIFVYDNTGIAGAHLPLTSAKNGTMWAPFNQLIKDKFTGSAGLKVYTVGWHNEAVLKKLSKLAQCHTALIQKETLETSFYQYLGVHKESKQIVRCHVPYYNTEMFAKLPLKERKHEMKIMEKSWDQFLCDKNGCNRI